MNPGPSALLCLLCWGNVAMVCAHEGHRASTYAIQPPIPVERIMAGPHLRLIVNDSRTDTSLAARFTLTVNGKPYVPAGVGEGGIRFESIHRSKRVRYIATYVKDSGEVLVPLPEYTLGGSVSVVRGFEYVPVTTRYELVDGRAEIPVKLKRWSDLSDRLWFSCDGHLHYDRIGGNQDEDWLAMMRGDGLNHAHFMVLKGGALEGVWAKQYAFGMEGERAKRLQFIRSGEEYRDAVQGHINLLGIAKLIQPISTGGIGRPKIPYNFPPLSNVLQEARQQGGIGGPAHGGGLAKSSTSQLDAILGNVDFFEIANSHRVKTDLWYELLNCGFITPPMAGTDLPNFAYRDPWQPLFGEIRTYVRMPGIHSFSEWKRSLKSGQVFITSGPLVKFSVNGAEAGQTVFLPEHGGEIRVVGELASPRELQSLEVMRMGKVFPLETKRTHEDEIHRILVDQKIAIKESCWLALRGSGVKKTALEEGLGTPQSTFAHSGIVQVVVGNSPIRSERAVEAMRTRMKEQRHFYETKAEFAHDKDRAIFSSLFAKALRLLE